MSCISIEKYAITRIFKNSFAISLNKYFEERERKSKKLSKKDVFCIQIDNFMQSAVYFLIFTVVFLHKNEK